MAVPAKQNKAPTASVYIASVSVLPSDTIEDVINKLGALKKQNPQGHYHAIFNGIALNSWEFENGKQVLEYYNKQKNAQRDKTDSGQAENTALDNRNNVRDFLISSMDKETRTVVTEQMIHSLETITDGRVIYDMQKQMLANLEATGLVDVQKQAIRDKINNLITATVNALHMKRELDAITYRQRDLEALDHVLRDELADEAAEKSGK